MSILVQARAPLQSEFCSTRKQSQSPAGKRHNEDKPDHVTVGGNGLAADTWPASCSIVTSTLSDFFYSVPHRLIREQAFLYDRTRGDASSEMTA